MPLPVKSVVWMLAFAYLSGIYPAVAQDVEFEWVVGMGGVDYERAADIALDGSGNIYTTGYFGGPDEDSVITGGTGGGSADFDPGPGTAILDSAGGRDIFVSKLDSLPTSCGSSC